MSSWVSHLPEDRFSEVVGVGMNEAELAHNPQLASWVVQDLNYQPRLPFAGGAFDGAVVSVSVQYLTRPLEVFGEVARVLAPGSPFVVTFSNRMFPTKAVAVWRALNDLQHADLVTLYFNLCGRFGPPEALDLSPNPGRSDPLYAVVADAIGAEAESTA